MRRSFDEQLALVNTKLIEMGGLCEEAIAKATVALLEDKEKYAKQAIDIELQINDRERDIEDLCMKLLLRQQPVAKDLRLISSALKMITDMERIGDQAADIAEIVLLGNATTKKQKLYFEDMAAKVVMMVTQSIDAFVKKDISLAQSVIMEDDYVDAMFVEVKKDLIKSSHEDEENIDVAIDLLMIAKYLERIGDHATNIAEWVVFAISGKHKGEEI